MKKNGLLKRMLVFSLSVILGTAPCISEMGTLHVQAASATGTASYADSESEVVGTWSANGTTYTNKSLLEKLPDVGSAYRFTTANYDSNNGAFDTSNWATSFMWDLDGDNPYSSSVYAIPLAFRAGVEGGSSNVMQVTAPSALSDAANNTYTMQMPSNGTGTDFFIQTPFSTSSAKVDAITDWSYDVVMEKSDDSGTYLKTTMVQGSIFAYFELVNANTLTITRGKGLPASVAYRNAEGNVIVIRCYDNQDEDYDYYAFYGAEGTSFQVTENGDKIASIAVSFTKGTYLSLAYLGSVKGSSNDAWGANMCQAYLPYAYNFVTDTRADYSFDEGTGKVRTVYTYSFNKKPESTGEGTIMGILPHQYKNILPGTAFLSYTYETVRGTMKTIAGSGFTTELPYSGILPFMPDYTDVPAEEAVITGYLDEYINQFGGNYFNNYEGTGDTYWDGKGLNRLSNAMAAAYAAGDGRADSMFAALKARLEEWFTYSGSADTTYFYYDDGVGSLFGFPQSYDSVNQINDHHFHYGYFIYAAAQVAFRDKDWASRYGGLVQELIYDIACPVRNSSASKYPYLRNFAPYEGHSWASGHANFDMGNNQESSSEALNAWAGIILWGEATGNKQLRDLGIYLYTTEISAVQNYWYDMDEDVLSDAYRYKVTNAEAGSIDKNNTEVVNNSAAIVWGGSYTYATWFSANPLYIQGINLLPMNPTCFYLAGNKDYIKQNYDLAYKKAAAASEGWDLESWIDIWCQYYAMAFPEEALAKWKEAEEGEGSYGVEGGDTKAHTYHFIKALCTYGTPDTSVTSDTVLSSVFVKDGVKTYCAYNAEAGAKTVTFSDGYQLNVPAGSMCVEQEGSAAGQTKYEVEYYVENPSGTYDMYDKESKYGIVGSQVQVTSPRTIPGYTYDEQHAQNILKAEVKADGSTTLKVYYSRAVYQITYELNGGVQNDGNPVSYRYKDSIPLLEPTKAGYNFTGWYTSPALSEAVTMIRDTDMGDLVLYAGWQDPFEYQLDAGKKVTYEDGKLVIRISNLGESDSATLFYRFYNSESEYASVIQDAGVGGLPGYAPAYDSAEGVWKYTISGGFSVGQYLVFKINTIKGGIGELSPWGIYQIPDENASSRITYYEKYYKENLDGSYSLAETVTKKAAEGTTVTCEEKIYTGFSYDSTNTDNVNSAVLNGTGIELKRYYKRQTYQITYHLNGGTGGKGNPSSYKYGTKVTLTDPVWTGYHFVGWYTDEACTKAFAGFDVSTSGDVVLWAKWLQEGSNEAAYKVEHYKETALDSNTYTLAESETLIGRIGAEVSAQAKTYEGYEENTVHGERKASGQVLEDGSLVLKLYYDVTDSGEQPQEGFGFTYDASAGKATFYYTGASGGIVYIAVCDDKETAQEYAKQANENPPGFDYVTGQAGYTMTQGDGCAQYEYAVAEGKYLVYAFNPDNQGLQKWYVGQAAQTLLPAAVAYTVKYYQQNTTLDGYTEAAVVNASGTENTTVNAEIRSYTGFTHNSQAPDSLLSGVLISGTELVLRVYYDRNKYPVVYHNLEGAKNPDANAAEYVYGVGLSFGNPVKEGYRFEGWYEDEACQNVPVTGIATDRTETVNVYAKWSREEKEAAYLVKYYLESLTAGKYAEVIADRFEGSGAVGETVHAEEKEYPGFSINRDASECILSGTLSAEETIILKVYYDREVYNITYHNMEEAENPESNRTFYRYGEGFALQNPQREKCTFAGWYLDENCLEENRITRVTEFQTGDLDLYAKWEKEKAAYTVRYYLQNRELNGYEEAARDAVVKTAEIGTRIDAKTEGYEKEYDGFVLNAALEESCLNGTVEKDNPLTLKLYYDRRSYSVTYANMEGAVNSAENADSYIYGVGLELREPQKENWIFAGWYLEETFAKENKVTSISTLHTGDVTVYARWIEQSSAASYTVAYYLQKTDLHGYAEAEADRFRGNGMIGEQVLAPVKEFEGFEKNEKAENYCESGIVTDDGGLELRIYYDRCTYEIVYHNVEDAKNPEANQAFYVYGIGFTFRNPVKDGYVFVGWYTNEAMEETDRIHKIGNEQTGSIHLYAKWRKDAEQGEEEKPDYGFAVDTIKDQYYTGSRIIPEVVVKDGDKILTIKKDYTIKISNNVNAGQAVVKITGKGNYSGTVEKKFRILPVDIGSGEMQADDIYKAYRKGKAIKVAPKLIWGKRTLKLNKDYKIAGNASYSAPGSYEVILEGMGNYTGIRALQFEITDRVLMSSVKTAKIAVQHYRNGEEIEPEVFATYKGVPLVENTDYTVEYENNTQAGTATAILTGTGKTYVGVKKISFKIAGADLKKMPITLQREEYEYTGSTVFPEYSAGSLKAGKDFTVSYTNNKEVGKGTVTFTGIGAYSGTVKKTFRIVPYNISNNAAGYFEDTTGEISVDYVKGGCTPSVELRFRGRILTEGTDYTLRYKKHTEVGTAASITITGKGRLKGSMTREFTITATDLDQMLLMAADVVYKTGKKASYYIPKITVSDKNGKKLIAGKDYSKKIIYSYETSRGTVVFDKKSRIGDLPVGTKLKVTVQGLGNYQGEACLEYMVVPASIKSAWVEVEDKAYTGQPVTLDKKDIAISVGNTPLGEKQFEIIEGSYLNNTKKGTAKVTLHGLGDYGGYKTISFKIKQRSIKDMIAGIFGRK